MPYPQEHLAWLETLQKFIENCIEALCDGIIRPYLGQHCLRRSKTKINIVDKVVMRVIAEM